MIYSGTKKLRRFPMICSFQSESIKVISQGKAINEHQPTRQHKNTKNTDCNDRQWNWFFGSVGKTPEGFSYLVFGCCQLTNQLRAALIINNA